MLGPHRPAQVGELSLAVGVGQDGGHALGDGLQGLQAPALAPGGGQEAVGGGVQVDLGLSSDGRAGSC